jgi:hypothetical protein
MNRRLQVTDFDPHPVGGDVDRGPHSVPTRQPDRVLVTLNALLRILRLRSRRRVGSTRTAGQELKPKKMPAVG